MPPDWTARPPPTVPVPPIVPPLLTVVSPVPEVPVTSRVPAETVVVPV
ncbi:MAG: hypothetical protein U0797_21475 [Gemmataceae bacterium]